MMYDYISRQVAIDVVHKSILDFFDICDDDEESPMTYKDERLLEFNKAITTQIKAVPSAQPQTAERTEKSAQNVPNSDLISRKAAIDAVRSYYDEEYDLKYSIEELIEKLPSAQIDLENKIRAIGYTGKEGRINIHGRLYAVRELAQ